MKKKQLPNLTQYLPDFSASEHLFDVRSDDSWGVYSPALHSWILRRDDGLVLLVPSDGLFERDGFCPIDVKGGDPFFEAIRKKYGMAPGIAGLLDKETNRAFLAALGKGITKPIRTEPAERFGVKDYRGIRLGHKQVIWNTTDSSRPFHIRNRLSEVPGVIRTSAGRYSGTEMLTRASLDKIKGWDVDVSEDYVLTADDKVDLLTALAVEEATAGAYEVFVTLDEEGIRIRFENTGLPLRFDLSVGQVHTTVFRFILREFTPENETGPLDHGLPADFVSQDVLDALEQFRLQFNRFAVKPIERSFYGEEAAPERVRETTPTPRAIPVERDILDEEPVAIPIPTLVTQRDPAAFRDPNRQPIPQPVTVRADLLGLMLERNQISQQEYRDLLITAFTTRGLMAPIFDF